MSSERPALEHRRCTLVRPAVGGSRFTPCGAGPNPQTQSRSPVSLAIWLRAAGWVKWGIGLGLTACAAAPKVLPNVHGQAEELPIQEVYFPLHDGHIFHYIVRGQDGRSGFLINKVARHDETATLTSGDLVQHLTIRSNGVYNEAGHYVVKLPMKVGAEWSGQSGVVRVVRAGQKVETGAGKFVECVVTREETQGTVEIRTVETTFCPNVGLVRLEVQALGEQVTAVELATLQYYGPPIDVNAL